MPFNGFTQEAYAQKLIDEYKAMRVDPRNVLAAVVQHRATCVTGSDASRASVSKPSTSTTRTCWPTCRATRELAGYKAEGINIWAPPTFALLALDAGGNIVPSEYARYAKAAGLDLITWTLERSGILADGGNGFYYQTIDSVIDREGDLYEVIDTLAQDVGILGVFSDWAAPVSFYASCMGLK